MTNTKYFFILGSENFLLKQEPLEEVLRERVQNFNRKNKSLNFWIIPNPYFLNNPEFIEIKNKVPEKVIAIVSTNKSFITWLKLRINNVAHGSFEKSLQNNFSPLKF